MKVLRTSIVSNFKRLSKANFLIALLSGLIYGFWSVFSNYEYELITWIIAGIVQGVYAFISTLIITHVAYWVFIKSDCGIKGIFVGFCSSFIIMIFVPLMVHNFFGTPNILQTILPGIILGSIYLLVFLIISEMK